MQYSTLFTQQTPQVNEGRGIGSKIDRKQNKRKEEEKRQKVCPLTVYLYFCTRNYLIAEMCIKYVL
jgi:hypothetical protein